MELAYLVREPEIVSDKLQIGSTGRVGRSRIVSGKLIGSQDVQSHSSPRDDSMLD